MTIINLDLYTISTTTVFLCLLIITYLISRKAEKNKLKNLESRSSFEAISTESPIDDSFEDSLDRGIENIETRYSYIRKISIPAIIVLWFALITLPNVGKVPQIYTSIVVGAITVLLSIASKPFIENAFSGLVISFGKTIRIGDTVSIDGHYGTVEEISMTYTIIKIWNWKRYVVPNSRLIQKEFVNHSLNDRHIWAHTEFSVAPDQDIELIQKLSIEAVKESRYFNNEYEDPSFWIMEMNENAIKCWVADWTSSPRKAWELKHETRVNLIKKFKSNNITTHLYNSSQMVVKNLS